MALFYFVLPTALASHWQEHVAESVRGRIAALWVLSFGGVIPIANLVGGRFVEATSLGSLMFVGVGAAIILGLAFRLRTGDIVDESIIATPVQDTLKSPA